MKSKYFSILLLLTGFLFVPVFNLRAQCNDEDFMDNCAELLDNYTFIKSFEHSDSKGGAKSENSYVFSKDHSYIITICDQGSAKLIVNLYDRNRKLISSNKASGKYFNKLVYQCTTTGVYYIESYLDNNSKGCGLSILGFKK